MSWIDGHWYITQEAILTLHSDCPDSPVVTALTRERPQANSVGRDLLDIVNGNTGAAVLSAITSCVGSRVSPSAMPTGRESCTWSAERGRRRGTWRARCRGPGRLARPHPPQCARCPAFGRQRCRSDCAAADAPSKAWTANPWAMHCTFATVHRQWMRAAPGVLHNSGQVGELERAGAL